MIGNDPKQSAISDGPWIRQWYGDLARQNTEDYRALGYNQPSSQRKRFEAMCQLGPFNGRRLLDVGCGTGDFFSYLLDKGIVPEYTGLDITPELIERAKAKYADHPHGRFQVGDILDFSSQPEYEYVIASGIFGLLSDNVEDRIEPTLRRLFSLAREGVAINFLSCQASRHAPGRLYVDPSRIMDMALKLTPSVVLNHNYLPNDFTIYIYRTPAWMKE